jgi:hypothetical protein
MRLDGQVHAAGLEHREDRGHPVQVALGHHRDDMLAAQPARQQGARQPVGPGVELGVSPLHAAVPGRDDVRVRRHLLLEQLVKPAVRQLPARPGEPFDLAVEFLGVQQALPLVLGVRAGRDQRERGEVIAGDPGRAIRVEHVGPVPQPQHEAAALRQDPHPRRDVLAGLAWAAAVVGRVEDRLERRAGEAELAPELSNTDVLMRAQLRLGPVGLQQQCPPRAGPGRQPAGQRLAARAGDVAGHDLVLARQRGEHLGVRGQQHRPQRHRQILRQPVQRRHQVIGDRRLVLAEAGYRIKGPARDGGEPAGEQHTAPELPAGLPRGCLWAGLVRDRRITQAGSGHVTSPWPGFRPTARGPGLPRPS